MQLSRVTLNMQNVHRQYLVHMAGLGIVFKCKQQISYPEIFEIKN